jgi:peroxiredoxin
MSKRRPREALYMTALLQMWMVLACLPVQFRAQNTPDDPYSIGVTMWEPRKDCPIFVGAVMPGSPAERAGIRAGDHLLAIGASAVENLAHAMGLLRSDKPAPVTLKLSRSGEAFEVTVERERRSVIYARNGRRFIKGFPVTLDTSAAEVEHMLSFDGQRVIDVVFPGHYPKNPELFYPGFELFILRDPAQVAVGGIEVGPGSRAGVHWGDVALSVNGNPTAGKTAAELERLFSSSRQELMHLRTDRLGAIRTVELEVERASEIARLNGQRFANGRTIPIWVTKDDLHCYDPPPNARVAENLLSIGSKAPGFTLLTPDGKMLSLASSQGTTGTLINFWFVNCPPCRHEFPALQNLYESYKEKGLAVLAIDHADTVADVKEYLSQLGITFPVVIGDDREPSVFSKYGVVEYPVTYLLDAEGKVVFRSSGSDVAGIQRAVAALVMQR